MARMIAAWLNISDRIRAAVAAAAMICLFFSDVVVPIEFNESQLYPAAILLLYRAREKRLIWALAGFAVVLAIGGYVIDPPANFWDGITNRLFSVLLVGVTALGLTKLADHEQRLIHESKTDPLTGLFNRRHFTELCQLEEGRARRHGFPFSVLMLDIDHFKRINDTHGHPVGDLAIKALAGMCQSSLRVHDLAARYGGEEFVLTLPQTDTEGATVVAERLRRKTEALAVASEGGEVHFTVSIGLATSRKDTQFEAVVESADQALYRAKQGGRNRVELEIRGTWRPRSAVG
jgi:diguanylate cyclase (GGDEF)-like protein